MEGDVFLTEAKLISGGSKMSNKLKVVFMAALVLAVIVALVRPRQYTLTQVTEIREITSTESKISGVMERSRKGVVHIMCPQWQGSGFVVTDRLIVTARHVSKGADEYTITTSDGHKLKATRSVHSKKHDLSFIWVDDLTCDEGSHKDDLTCSKSEHSVTLHPLPLGSIQDCRLGQSVFCIGSPYGKINFNALSTGVISGVDRDWSPLDKLGNSYGKDIAFTVDSAGHPGNSGCPVFTTDGVVRGILVGGFSPVLISVMPCDLFLQDIPMICGMFSIDKYEVHGKSNPVIRPMRLDALWRLSKR